MPDAATSDEWRTRLTAEVLLGQVIEQALAESSEVDHVVSENGNGTWYEVAMADGTLVQVTIEASRP